MAMCRLSRDPFVRPHQPRSTAMRRRRQIDGQTDRQRLTVNYRATFRCCSGVRAGLVHSVDLSIEATVKALNESATWQALPENGTTDRETVDSITWSRRSMNYRHAASVIIIVFLQTKCQVALIERSTEVTKFVRTPEQHLNVAR